MSEAQRATGRGRIDGRGRTAGRGRIVGRLGPILLAGVALVGCQAQIDAAGEPGDTSRGLETTLSLASVAAGVSA